MADYETQLIQKAVSHGGIEKLLAHGIEESHFADESNKAVWNFLREHVRRYRTTPSFDVVKERFPEYIWQIITDPLEFVQDQFVASVKRQAAVDSFRQLASVLDENKPEEISKIDEIFLDSAKELAQVVPSTSVTRFSSMPSRIDLYRQRKAEGINPGIPFGVDGLDELTLGLQSHEYVTIAGWTGIGKSTLALLFSINHYVDGYTPMIISLEMDSDEIYRKLDSIAVGLRQHAMKQMTLHPNDMKRWENYAERVQSAANDIIIVDVDFATPEKVYAETARWNPDVVVVDYIQLLLAPKNFRATWERVGFVSQMMKAMARQLRIPVYGLAQTNADSADEGARLSNIGGSKDIGRHSDIVLALNQDENMASMNKMELRIEKNRGGPRGVIPLYWSQATSEFRDWKVSDAYSKKEEI